MKKQIEVCDFCEEEKPLQDIDGKRCCQRCQRILYESVKEAIREVQKKVDFSVGRRLTLLSLLENNADEKYWGSEGIKMREEIIESFRKE